MPPDAPDSQAVICRAFGPPGEMRLETVRMPAPGPGQVVVKLRAAGINFPDLLMVEGKYQLKPDLPFTPGMEAAGVVARTGPEADAVRAGDKVIVQVQYGAFAEQIVVPAAALVALPPGLSFAEGASLLVAHRTAWHALQARAGLRPGEVLLVQGAAGGVGLAATELGHHLGATVIAVASTAEKRDVARRRGADHTLAGSGPGLVAAVMALTGGRGVDVVLDPVGGQAFEDSMRCLAWGGRLLVVGFAGGTIPSVKVNRILMKACSVIGVRVGEAARHDPAAGTHELRELLELVASAGLRPHISQSLPLPRFAEAMQLLQDRKAIGRVVLTMGRDADG